MLPEQARGLWVPSRTDEGGWLRVGVRGVGRLVGEYVGCNQVDEVTWEFFWRDLLLGFIDVTRIDQGLLHL